MYLNWLFSSKKAMQLYIISLRKNIFSRKASRAYFWILVTVYHIHSLFYFHTLISRTVYLFILSIPIFGLNITNSLAFFQLTRFRYLCFGCCFCILSIAGKMLSAAYESCESAQMRRSEVWEKGKGHRARFRMIVKIMFALSGAHTRSSGHGFFLGVGGL